MPLYAQQILSFDSLSERPKTSVPSSQRFQPLSPRRTNNNGRTRLLNDDVGFENKQQNKTMNRKIGNKLSKNGNTRSIVPKREEIESLKKEIRQTRPKSILWGDTTYSLVDQKLATDFKTTETIAKKKFIVDNTERMDINELPKATKLISTTAFIQDYIGYPNSLAFIR